MRRWFVCCLLLLVGCGSGGSTGSSRAVSMVTPVPTRPAATPTLGLDASMFPKLREPLAPIAADDPRALGDPKAPVTIVEYSDFQCPFCRRHFLEVFPALKAKYIDTGKVRYVFRHYIAVPSHTSAPAAAVATQCAAEQNKFWDLHDVLYQQADEWTPDPAQAMPIIAGYSQQLGLDMTKFETCVSDPSVQGIVRQEINEATTLGASGTPSFFVGQYYLNGALPSDVFDFVIDLALNEQQ